MAKYVIDESTLTDIGDQVRRITKNTGKMKPKEMITGLSTVDPEAAYETGKQDGIQSEYDRFWDVFQQNGTLTNYRYAFSQERWTDVSFKPKYDIKPSGSNSMTHFMTNSRITDVVAILNECGVKLDTSGAAGNASTWFSGSVTRLPAISLENVNTLINIFGWCGSLHTIEKVILKEDGTNTFTDPFVSCGSLTNITIEGKIGQNGFNVQQSKKLTHDSLMSIINALQDKSEDTSGTTWSITLGNDNLDKLSEAEKLLMDAKGWSYS